MSVVGGHNRGIPLWFVYNPWPAVAERPDYVIHEGDDRDTEPGEDG